MRLAVCPGKGGKPSVLITKTFEIYLGNPTDEEMLVQSCDIIGFYTGAFEIKIIKSTVEAERRNSCQPLQELIQERLICNIEPTSFFPRGDSTSERISPWNPWDFIDKIEIDRKDPPPGTQAQDLWRNTPFRGVSTMTWRWSRMRKRSCRCVSSCATKLASVELETLRWETTRSVPWPRLHLGHKISSYTRYKIVN